jgi:hypothetical protein
MKVSFHIKTHDVKIKSAIFSGIDDPKAIFYED